MMTITSRLLSLRLAVLFVTTSLSALPTTAKAEPFTIKAAHQVKPQLVHRRHRAHRWHRHHRHAPRLGLRIVGLPKGYFKITFGGARLFVHGGVFYRPAGAGFVVVKAPYGVVVKNLPPGYRVIHRGGATYYHYHDTYYASHRSGLGYVVIAKPLG